MHTNSLPPQSSSCQKLVTIIIPCYNDGKYLEDALTSALSQDYVSKEIIIVDDHSTDKFTLSKLEDITKRGIKVIQTPPNKKGLAAARNAGIVEASGDYILPLDADDKIEPTYVKKAVRVLESDANVTICTTGIQFFGLRHNKWPQPEATYANILTEECKIVASSLFRKRDWERVGGYEERLILGKEDMIFWLDLLAAGGRVHTLPEILFHYRIRPNSMTARTPHNASEAAKITAMYESRPQLFQAHAIDLLQQCARYREADSRRCCLLLWKLLSPVLKIEWFFRQKIKRLMGRA